MAIDPLGTLIEQFSTIYDKINGENNKIAETVEEAKKRIKEQLDSKQYED